MSTPRLSMYQPVRWHTGMIHRCSRLFPVPNWTLCGLRVMLAHEMIEDPGDAPKCKRCWRP